MCHKDLVITFDKMTLKKKVHTSEGAFEVLGVREQITIIHCFYVDTMEITT